MWKPEDIQINVYSNAVPGATYSIRMTHLPTGTVAKGVHKSYFRARKIAEEELTNLLKDNG